MPKRLLFFFDGTSNSAAYGTPNDMTNASIAHCISKEIKSSSISWELEHEGTIFQRTPDVALTRS